MRTPATLATFFLALAAAQACTISVPAGVLGQVQASPSACAAPFAQFDQDKDGSWSQAEFAAYFATLPQTAIACLDPNDPTKTITCPQHDPAVQFKRYDADGDGKLSQAEVCAGPTRPEPTPTPIKGPPPPVPSPLAPGCQNDFTSFDTNHDGALSYDEYVEGRYGKIRYIKAPTEQEIATAKAGLRDDAKQLDTNGDQKLDTQEFGASCQ